MGLGHSKDIWEGNFYTSAGASPGAGSFREESTLPQLLPPPSPPPKTEAKRHQKPYAKCNGDTTYNATLGSSPIRRCKTLGFLAVAARLPPKCKFQRHPFLYLSFPFRVIRNLHQPFSLVEPGSLTTSTNFSKRPLGQHTPNSLPSP